MPRADLHEVYERGFRSLLWRLQPADLQASLERLFGRVAVWTARGVAPFEAYQQVYERTVSIVWRWLIRRRRRRIAGASVPLASEKLRGNRLPAVYRRNLPKRPFEDSPDFQCDAAMGGLARWLRAAGYDAAWWPGIADDDILRKTIASSAIMLTTDSALMQRGVIVDGVVPALLVPNILKKRDQLAWVMQRLTLPLKPSRCMACGGRLHRVEKWKVQDRIPPRTYDWLNDYLLCDRCDRLFWPGTHWSHINELLQCLRPRY